MKGMLNVVSFLLLVMKTFSLGSNNDTKAQLTIATDCTLGSQAKSGCDTSIARGITDQILSELGNMGYSFQELDPQWIHCDGSCVNQLQEEAANSLASAAQYKNDYITLNSAVRSSAQQYLLYQWYLEDICGISLAAVPGTSNHEGGAAIDTSYYNYWESTLEAYGWTHTYPTSDPVHFDYSSVKDLAAQNLMAFQRLWNKNNPNSQIVEDGIYGKDTASAFYNTPCNGW